MTGTAIVTEVTADELIEIVVRDASLGRVNRVGVLPGVTIEEVLAAAIKAWGMSGRVDEYQVYLLHAGRQLVHGDAIVGAGVRSGDVLEVRWNAIGGGTTMTVDQVKRRRHDLAELRALCERSGGRIAIDSTEGDPPSEFRLRYVVRTLGPSAADAAPRVRRIHLHVMLPGGYPNPGNLPSVVASDQIYHPHFWDSSEMCTGSAALQGLAPFAEWIGRVLVLDPAVINPGSPANPVAMRWFIANRHRCPLDPSDFQVPVYRDPETSLARVVQAPAPSVRPRIEWR